ncbi:hypothetical protein [Pseudonocardia pini]|uniref:hypothetical protein n=1 Tax=Pseudonocardia pini TaxID=2758030 RepID=UPI0015EFF125|nr:hypothetical protein [Pseudonocardia pini]
MFTPILCPGCTAIVIVPEFDAHRRCPCCGIDVAEPHEAELVPLPVRVQRPEAA